MRVKKACSPIASRTENRPPSASGVETRNGPTWNAPSGRMAGKARVSAVQTSWAVPRSMMSSATLAMKIAKAGWLISGRKTKRSRIRPKAMQAASVSARLITSGTGHPAAFMPAVKVHSRSAPMTSTSPWARFTMREAR